MKRNIYIDFSYLVLLSISLGGILVLGIFVAPTVFHTEIILMNGFLSHYEAGLVMSKIFYKFSYWIYFLAFCIAFYEGYMYKNGARDTIAIFASFVSFSCSLLFSGVYVPKILNLQKLGSEASLSDTFQNLHLASELDFKVLALGLLVLFIRRLMLLRIK